MIIGPGVLVSADLAAEISLIVDGFLRRERPASPELLRLAAELRAVAAQMAEPVRSIDTDETSWLTVNESARRSGISPRSVRRRAAQGRIPARRGTDGRTWLIATDDSTRRNAWSARSARA